MFTVGQMLVFTLSMGCNTNIVLKNYTRISGTPFVNETYCRNLQETRKKSNTQGYYG